MNLRLLSLLYGLLVAGLIAVAPADAQQTI